MATLHFLIGLPASGKSYFAESLKLPIVSSDNIRETVFGDVNDQTHNKEVFEIMETRVYDFLAAGVDCVYDATNLTRKLRVAFMNRLRNNPKTRYSTVIAHFIATPLTYIFQNNRVRDRFVPESVIYRMLESFDPPMKEEGFNDVRLVYPRIETYRFYSMRTVLDLNNIPHDNPHHEYPVRAHMVAAYDYLEENYEFINVFVKEAAKIHDIGKFMTKTFDKDGIAHYYNHAAVGAYLSYFVDTCGGPNAVNYRAALIAHHMDRYSYPKDMTEDMIREKLAKKFKSESFANDLMLLMEADVHAH